MAQTLTTTILINAKTGSGFAAVGATLTELGSLVDGVSQELINFGKDSVNVYREYEESMKDAEVALSTTYGRNTKELSSVMSQLDTAATGWAATTVFHTNDVANAISEAAHAGWDFNQIMTGIPAAIELANAGSLDLSEAVNYIVKAANGMGLEFDAEGKNIGNLVDLWAYAANSSATTIDEVGQAMLRMGSTMRFTEGTEELMTLIAVTANAGSVGSEAGTMIRNSIMRLAAPTDKAKEVLGELGATSEEVVETLNDEALAAANARLAAQGFSAYDQHGKLKPVLDTYRDLYVALGNINGGFEDIEDNQDVVGILHNVFQNRSITEALTLLRAASESYDGLYEKMKNGDAEGYGEYAAQTRVETLNGKIKIFESKVERLEQAVGKELAPQLESVLGSLGGIVDSISGMDEGQFSALVSGLEVIAGAGPALLLAGGAFRLIASVLTPAGGIGLGLIALTAAAAAIKELEEADFAKAFGTADIDNEAIQSYVEGLSSDFEEAYTQVNNFNTAVGKSVTAYKNASKEFSSNLLTDMLTGATLSEEDIKKLNSLGDDMHQAVIDGIENSTAASLSYWEMLFGGEEEAGENEDYQDIVNLTNVSYEEGIAKAREIGQKLREAMTEAFADGQINEKEYANILSYVQSYNEAIAEASAEAQRRQDYINQQMLLDKAQTASLDEIKETAAQIQEERDRVLGEAEEEHLSERFGLEYDYDQAIENGTEINGKTVTEADKERALAAVDEKYSQLALEQGEKYDDILYKLWDSQINQSDYAEAYQELGSLADLVMQGGMSADSAVSLFKKQYGNNKYAGENDWGSNNDRTRISELLARQIAGYGGYEGLEARITDYESKGQTENANALRRLYTMQQINDAYARTGVVNYSGLLSSILGEDTIASLEGAQKSQFTGFMEGFSSAEYSTETARKTVEALGGGDGSLQNLFSEIREEIAGENVFGHELGSALLTAESNGNTEAELYSMFGNLSQNYDLARVVTDTISSMPMEWRSADNQTNRDLYGMYQLMYGEAAENAESYRITVTPEVDESSIGELDPVPLPIEPRMEGTDAADQLQQQGVEVQVDGDVQQLTATIDGEDGQTLMEYVDGDATQLEATITPLDGKTLTEHVTGDASSLAAIINSYNGRTITVNIQGNKMFASGGRATTASIFGEAGPEWAIPEEHSERTADLLNAAREASGFTWPDLLARYGGLNANTDREPTTIIYSPTIHAADASGVEQVLLADKERLNRWFEEKKMRDEVEVYA